MNRTLLSILSMTLVAAAGSVSAQSVPINDAAMTNDVTLRGAVAAGCLLDTPTSPSSSNAQIGALGPGTADIAINQLVDESGASIGALVILVLPATCNQAHTLNLLSLNGGLRGEAPEPVSGPFRSSLPYQVTVSWGESLQVFQSLDQALEVAFGQALSGVITLTIQIPSGGAPLTAGAYADELVLELGVAG